LGPVTLTSFESSLFLFTGGLYFVCVQVQQVWHTWAFLPQKSPGVPNLHTHKYSPAVKRNKKASNDVRLTGPKGEPPPPIIRANRKAPLAIHSLHST
jgi:hypothetical protein